MYNGSGKSAKLVIYIFKAPYQFFLKISFFVFWNWMKIFSGNKMWHQEINYTIIFVNTTQRTEKRMNWVHFQTAFWIIIKIWLYCPASLSGYETIPSLQTVTLPWLQDIIYLSMKSSTIRKLQLMQDTTNAYLHSNMGYCDHIRANF